MLLHRGAVPWSSLLRRATLASLAHPACPPPFVCSQADAFASQEAQLADDKRRLKQHVREREASAEELIKQFRWVLRVSEILIRAWLTDACSTVLSKPACCCKPGAPTAVLVVAITGKGTQACSRLLLPPNPAQAGQRQAGQPAARRV